MSRTQLDDWLDDELVSSELQQFESWLRESPDNLELHFQEASFQEQLRFQFRARKPVVAQVSTSTRTLWQSLALCAAACVLIAYYIVSRSASLSPTADPQLFVMIGKPRIERTQLSEMPGPLPTAQAPTSYETVVETSDNECVVRWHDIYEISLQPKTLLELQSTTSNSNDDEPHPYAASLRLKHGALMLKAESVDNPLDLWVADINIRIESPAVLEVSQSNADSIEPSAELMIRSGSAVIRKPGVADRRMNAGQKIDLSTW